MMTMILFSARKKRTRKKAMIRNKSKVARKVRKMQLQLKNHKKKKVK